jgi:hypothetical protein
MSRCRLTFFLADSKKDLPRITHSSSGGKLGCVLSVYFLRSPSRAPYRTPSACAKRATYSDPPPRSPSPIIHRCPGGLCRGSIARVGSELFPGIGVLPGPATESHIVNRGALLLALFNSPFGQPQPKVPERKSHPRGKPLQPRFSKYHELFEEPLAAGPRMTH